jgi:hypothetical protein
MGLNFAFRTKPIRWPSAGQSFAVVLGAMLCGWSAIPAHAQQRIGEAAHVSNQVVRVNAGRSQTLTTGGSVFRNETIRTGRAGAARLVFLDFTNLMVGPSSSVVLNRFVFSGESSRRALTVNLARGAFRFTTGRLDKRAYKIRTPLATIGVRGTVLGIQSLRRISRITLSDNGAALVCARFVRRCLELTRLGDSVEVTRSGIRRVAAGARKFTFASICGANAGLCSTTQVADAGPVSVPPALLGDALCGR